MIINSLKCVAIPSIVVAYDYLYPSEESIFSLWKKNFVSTKEQMEIKLNALKKNNYAEFVLMLQSMRVQDVPISHKALFETLAKIDALLKKRKLDPTEEKERLDVNPRVIAAFTRCRKIKLFMGSLDYFPTIIHENGFKQSIELQDLLKKDYYVINHGQSNRWLVLNILTKKINECVYGKRYLFFEPLRNEIFLKTSSQEKDVEWYKNELKKPGSTDGAFHVDLLSCDINLESRMWLESALDVFVRERSVKESDRLDYLLKGKIDCSLAKRYGRQIIDEELNFTHNFNHDLIDYVATLCETIQGATLYSICIPKERFHEIGYASQAFGTPLDRSEEFFNRAQEGEVNTTTQVRLLAKKLTPENGVFIIRHSTLSKEQLNEIEEKIENLVRTLLYYADVEKRYNNCKEADNSSLITKVRQFFTMKEL